jgi:hypothetical protein
VQEIETHWSIDDLISAHLTVDLREELEAKAAEKEAQP